jgi:hypothetical protein
MRKKAFPFNWVGTILISAYIVGWFLFCWGIYQCASFPEREFLGDSEMGLVVLIIFGSIYSAFGITVAIGLAVKFNREKNFTTCPQLTALVRVASKFTRTIYTGGNSSFRSKRAIYTICYIYFEFANGSSKAFNVDANIYSSVLEHDFGLLTYKEHKDQTLFVAFNRRS